MNLQYIHTCYVQGEVWEKHAHHWFQNIKALLKPFLELQALLMQIEKDPSLLNLLEI